MASRKRKENGGWEKLKQKKAKSLEEDASKCRKLTELFGSSATASSSTNVDVGQSMLSENQVDIQPDQPHADGSHDEGQAAEGISLEEEVPVGFAE